MTHLPQANKLATISYRPIEQLCPWCQGKLKRWHILWRKQITFSTGIKWVTNWAYHCPQPSCLGTTTAFRSQQAEREHLFGRRFSRELVIRLGYRRFWQHQTRAEVHEWLTQELHVSISEREIDYLWLDFLALLRSAQPSKVRQKLGNLTSLLIGLDGMQPEKGNDCLYIVRELQSGVTLRAETLEESSHATLSQQLLEPLKTLATELGLKWRGVVSDAQESIRLAIAQSLPGVPHQVCQVHCLCDAGKPTFEADRAMKKVLKSAFRNYLSRLRKSIQGLPEDNRFRPILLGYANALRATLLQAGIAPFGLGGVQIFEDLASLEGSLLRCQKKPITRCFTVYWSLHNAVFLLPPKSNGIAGNVNG